MRFTFEPAQVMALLRSRIVGQAAALAQVVWHYGMIRERTRDGCFRAFRLNHWLGLTLFLGVVGHYALKALG